MMFRPIAMLCGLLLTPPVFAAPQGLFDVYQENREQGIANLITPDLLLVSYSLVRQQLNQQTEAHLLIPAFGTLVKDLHEEVTAGKKDAVGKLGRDYLSLLRALLDGTPLHTPSPALQQEWNLVQQAGGIALSPLWGIQLDYSQFKPRGRYTLSENLQHYFVAYRYASSVNLFIQPSLATAVSPEKAAQFSELAVRLSQLLHKNVALKKSFAQLRAASDWEYGVPGDLNADDIPLALKDENKPARYAAALLRYAQQNHKLPQVIDVPIDTSKLAANEKLAEVALGWRLVPSRLNADSLATQAVLYPQTQQFLNPCGTIACTHGWSVSQLDGRAAKGYVSGLEIMGWLGSDSARYLSQRQGDQAFVGYAAAEQRAKIWLQNTPDLSGAQMQFMRTVFGQSTATPTRQLNSLLGFWTWQRNINALYAKQPTSIGSKGLNGGKVVERKGAQLLGSTAFYQAFADLLKQQQPHGERATWQALADISTQLAKLAAQSALSSEDEAFLNGLDERLLGLTKVKDQPIVIDVQSNPADQQVVEEAIGLPEVEQRGGARGAWFSHYEFKRPLNARLTHEEWRKQLQRAE